MNAISATVLRDHLRAARARSITSGRRLNEGAARVLQKLEESLKAAGLHRAYRKEGGRVVMWDLVSDQELVERGYVETRRDACAVWAEETVKRDRVTCWMSEVDPDGELWVGQALHP